MKPGPAGEDHPWSHASEGSCFSMTRQANRMVLSTGRSPRGVGIDVKINLNATIIHSP